MGVLLEDGRQLPCPGERQSLKRRRCRAPPDLLSQKHHSFSQLTDCHSQISSSAPSVSVGLHPSLLSKTLAKTVFFPPSFEQQKYCTLIQMQGNVWFNLKRCTYYLKEFFLCFSLLRSHMHKEFSSSRGQEKTMDNMVLSTL